MLSRRTVMTGAVAAGLAGTGIAAGGPAAAATGSGSAGGAQSTRDDREVADLLRQLLNEVREGRASCAAFTCAWTDRIRQTQKQFFKANAKFPDFIDVGIDVWEKVYDWHVRSQQPLAVSRLADGRIAMAFMLTTLVLRADVANDFVSLGYDAK